MEVEKKELKQMQKLYRTGVSERLKATHMLRKGAGKLAALNTSTDGPFKITAVYLKRIDESMGEDAVKVASAVISLFDTQFSYERAQSVALDLARIADYGTPKAFSDATNQITTALKSKGSKAASEVSFRLGLKAFTDSLKDKVSDGAIASVEKELSYSHILNVA